MVVGWIPQLIFCPLFPPKGIERIYPPGGGWIGWTSFSLHTALSVSHCQLVFSKTVPLLPLGGPFLFLHVPCLFGSLFYAIKIAEYESGVGETHNYLPMCQSFSLLPIFLGFLWGRRSKDIDFAWFTRGQGHHALMVMHGVGKSPLALSNDTP